MSKLRGAMRAALISACFAALPVSMFAQMQAEHQQAKPPKIDLHQISGDQKILQGLNRLTFGPRPGDFQRVKKIGLGAWIQQQLHPEAIADDDVDTKLAKLTLLKMTGNDIAEMDKAVQMSNRDLLKIQNEMAQRGAAAGAIAIQGAVSAAQTNTNTPPVQQVKRAIDIYANATPDERMKLDAGREARLRVQQAGSELVTNKLVRACESNRQLFEVMVDFWTNHFNIDASKVRSSILIDDSTVIRPFAMGKFRDLLMATATSPAMMLYLDNAQSVAAQANQSVARPLQTLTFDQVRAAADRGQPAASMVVSRATEISKAQNISIEEAYKKIQAQRANAETRPRVGLNENYARELMELHTLGVDGGYSQKDVTEVARCLTGWGIKGGRGGAEFEFHPKLHDRGDKTVLGTQIPSGGGIEDGEMVLTMLASHPSTMRFVSTKLCRRFISDNPPPSVVSKCVDTWKKTDGDIREVLATIFTSREFNSRYAYRSKIKSPFEYVVSAVRASGCTVVPDPQPPAARASTVRPAALLVNLYGQNGSGQNNPRLLAGQIGLLGEPLFNFSFPTGYPEESSKWVSTGALIGRINFATALVNGKILDVDQSGSILLSAASNEREKSDTIETMARTILGSSVDRDTRATIDKQLSELKDGVNSDAAKKRIAALLLGSPDFQRR